MLTYQRVCRGHVDMNRCITVQAKICPLLGGLYEPKGVVASPWASPGRMRVRVTLLIFWVEGCCAHTSAHRYLRYFIVIHTLVDHSPSQERQAQK